ncbi:MAG: hypothetical protein KDI09_15700, partial [Halioglobus sp.]|nr:hypothetical protein [Halioglobus sp.]
MSTADTGKLASAAADRELLDKSDHAYLAPLFLGPSGENAALLETLLTSFLRDHVYWRRNFHPEDPPSIPVAVQYREDFQSAASRLEQALFRLSADLKQSVPSFAPRYIGHMVSDPLLAGLLGQLITTLYNPNNIASEAAPVTLELELEVGRQLATMLGMKTATAAGPQPWGHITSGGTVANYEALWLLRAARLFPPALAAALRQLRSKLPPDLILAPQAERPPLADLDQWSLLNFTTDRACELYSSFLGTLDELEPPLRRQLVAKVAAERHEYLGPDFFVRHGSTVPVVIVPATAHYSWSKAMTVLGMGRSRLLRVPTDTHMRMDAAALEEILEKNLRDRQVVLAVVGVLGTTEFGTIDPLHKIAALRKRYAARGLGFAFHVDAAWGGYLSTIFRKADGGLRARKDMRKQFQFFPSPSVYEAFRALEKADTVTVDPHKLGYISYGAGALVARDHRLTSFVGEKPP